MRVMVALVILTGIAFARDDGRYTNSPLKPWMDRLSSQKGLCCSFADGRSIADVDWDVIGNHYRVRVDGAWFDVPDNAVVSETNRLGEAVVWPYRDVSGAMQIRCFMPGAQS